MMQNGFSCMWEESWGEKMPQVEDPDGPMREWFLWSAEVDESFGAPLVVGRPNLWVGRTRQDPETHVAQLGRGRRRSMLKGHVVGPRLDLCRREAMTDWTSRREKSDLMARLRELGHRVNGTPPHEYRVYVIEMTDDGHARENDPALPWVYVGETTKAVDERIREHRDDLRSGKGHGLSAQPFPERFVRGRPDLFECHSPVYSRADSQALENRVKADLAKRGYTVWRSPESD